jgi:hypothetical protein
MKHQAGMVSVHKHQSINTKDENRIHKNRLHDHLISPLPSFPDDDDDDDE